MSIAKATSEAAPVDLSVRVNVPWSRTWSQLSKTALCLADATEIDSTPASANVISSPGSVGRVPVGVAPNPQDVERALARVSLPIVVEVGRIRRVDLAVAV